MSIITCRNCKKEFGYEFIGTVYPGGKDKEEVCCPYCDTVALTKMTSQSPYVYKIDSQGNVIE